MEGDIFCDVENEIKSRDLISASPQIRANAIWMVLQKQEPRPTLWDLTCFSVEALGIACAEYPILLATVKLVTKLVYSMHYHTTEVFPSAYRSGSGQVSGSNQLPESGTRSALTPQPTTESRIS